MNRIQCMRDTVAVLDANIDDLGNRMLFCCSPELVVWANYEMVEWSDDSQVEWSDGI